MEDIIQTIIDKYIPFDVKKTSLDEREIRLYIYLKDNQEEIIISMNISYEKARDPIYAWFDLRDESRIEVIDITKSELLEKIRQIRLKDVYKIEECFYI